MISDWRAYEMKKGADDNACGSWLCERSDIYLYFISAGVVLA